MNKKLLHSIFILLFSIIICGCIDNAAPVADAGPDRTVNVPIFYDANAGSSVEVTLSGEASFDPNGDTLMFHWGVESVPAGSKAMLENLHAEKTTLEVDVVGTYEISLIVDDGEQRSQKDFVLIHYVGDVNRPPTFPPGNGKHPMFTGACVHCHDGIDAAGKAVNHLPTTNDCGSCHSLEAWVPAVFVSHTDVSGLCESCHNGIVATGKSSAHILSSDACDQCHSTVTWTPIVDGGSPNQPPIIFDHTGIVEGCSSCHQLTQRHIYTTDKCESCHFISSWVPVVRVNHDEVIGQCVECHNGVFSIAKSASHINTTDSCDACHSTLSFIPVIEVDHTNVIGGCASCHNGTVATGKTATHLPTSDICEACHSTQIWWPVIMVDHNEVLGSCASCHAYPASHEIVENTGVPCDECHTVLSWAQPTRPLPVNGK